MAVAQIAPDAVDDSDGDRARVLEYAGQFAPEQLQLFYQTALLGRRDLPLAPDARSGFEMTLLRLLLFKPVGALPSGAGAGKPAAMGAAGVPQPGKPSSPAEAAGHISSNPASQSVSPEESIPARALGSASDHLSKMKATLGDSSSARTSVNAVPQGLPPTSKPVERALKQGPDKQDPPPQQAISAPAEAMTGSDIHQSQAKAVQSVMPASLESGKPPSLNRDTKPTVKTNVIKLGDEWADLVGILELDGPVRNFARNCSLEAKEGARWVLAISPRFEALYKEENRDLLAKALSENAGQSITLRVDVAEPGKPTPDQLLAQYKQQRKEEAIALMQSDAFVQDLQNLFGATLDLNSVTPVDDD